MKKKTIGKRIFAVVMALCIVMMYSVVAFAEEGNEPTVPTCPDHQDSVMELVEGSDTATCTQAGTVTYKCPEEGCEETKTVTVEATGHSWNTGEVITAAKCTESGEKIYTCDVCNETKTETIPATGHDWDQQLDCCKICNEIKEPVAEIGAKKFAFLDKAVKAALTFDSGETITLLDDCEVESISVDNKKKITLDCNGYSIKSQGGKQWTIDGDLVINNGTIDIDGSTIWVTASSKVTLCNNTKVNMDGLNKSTGGTGYYDIAFKLNPSSILTIDNSTLDVTRYGRTSKGGAIKWADKPATVNINNGSTVTLGSTTATDRSMGNYSGFIGTLTVNVNDSTLNVCNNSGNGSNGARYNLSESRIDFVGNGSLGLSAADVICENSILNLNKNGNAGLVISDGNSKSYFDKDSKVYVNNNKSNIYGGFFAGSDITFESGSVLEVKDNAATGIIVPVGELHWVKNPIGELTIEDGVKVTITGNNNDSEKTDKSKNTFAAVGGGMWIRGSVRLPEDAVLYNNHAKTAGDDIYVYEGGSISFGPVGSNWILDDCNHKIDGWYYDNEVVAEETTSNLKPASAPVIKPLRWNVDNCNGESEPYYVECEAGTYTGVLALKAAHGKLDKLSYDANGGTGTMTDSEGPEKSDVDVKGNEFTRTGYTFTGWNTKKDGTGKAYKAEDKYTLTDEEDILYAQWTVNATAPIVTPENPQNPPQDPEVKPDGNPDDIPSDNPEDKPSVDPNGGSDAIDGDDDGIEANPNGDPDAIGDDEEDIDATPKGVKTGDSTDMIPWALGFGTAVMLLAGAVALRRREE